MADQSILKKEQYTEFQIFLLLQLVLQFYSRLWGGSEIMLTIALDVKQVVVTVLFCFVFCFVLFFFLLMADFHWRRSRSRSRSWSRRRSRKRFRPSEKRKSESHTESQRFYFLPIPLMTPMLMILWKLDCRSSKRLLLLLETPSI